MIKILFFGQLKELLKQEQLQVDLSELNQGPIQVSTIRAFLENKYQDWSEFLVYGRALVAVNQELVSEESEIKDNDEVAFFPPVTGG